MSPAATQAASSKDHKSGGKDIRAFLAGAGGRSSTITGQKKVQPKESRHFAPAPKTAKSPAQGSTKTAPIEIDVDEKPPSNAKNGSTKRKAVSLSSDEDDDDKPLGTPPQKKVATSPRKSNGVVKTRIISSDEEEEEERPKKKQTTVSKPASTAKRQKTSPKRRSSIAARKKDDDNDFFVDDTSDEDLQPTPGKGKSKARPSVASTKTRKVNDSREVKKEESRQIEKPAPKPKPNWVALKAARAAGPSAPGSKPIPEGESNCLAGLSFVFTGELSSLSRDEAVDLAKRYGGRVVGQPSSKTSFVVVGDNAGPSKLAAIEKHKLRKINEDDFLNLIATRSSDSADDKTKAKMRQEEQKMRKAAEEMEKAERKEAKDRAKAAASAGGSPTRAKLSSDTNSQLWTVRYAPKTLKEICGNKGQVEKLHQWLLDWPSSVKSNFKKPGKNGMNVFRAVLISGPPGIGKTTSAHICAKLAGFTPIELNASDARSKKLVENSTNITNTSLDGWMSGRSDKAKSVNVAGIEISDKACLIMDEVDGMSAGDRGGVGALNTLIKKTKIPIICIANDRNAQKLRPLMNTTFNLSFRKPDAAAVRSRIMTIAFKEKMKIPANVVDQLVQGAQSDIRQVLNMLSTWKLSNSEMDFDEGKNLAKMNEKYSIMTPFNVINKMLGPYLFSSTARESLGDKIELYFHDHAFVPLFIQENYLKTDPARLRNYAGPERTLQHLKLMDKAASSISDSDLVDSLIHGPEQNWSLMPLHAITSTVRPASILYGNGLGYGGQNAMSFPQWLGQNSKQNKLKRQLGDVQIRMRLKVSGDKPEIRQQYIPALFPRIVKPLIDAGVSAVDEVIETMDDYYLSKEEWDTIVELGVDQNRDDVMLKKISSATKSAFTRKYNSTEHPVPFHKAQEFGKVPKKIVAEPAPDLEEAFDLDDDVDEEPEQKDEEDEDISKDSLIKTASGGVGKGKGKGKAKAAAGTAKSSSRAKK
ncbi:hypothetical protein ACEPAG_3492 [Sanghuangporus baumii]